MEKEREINKSLEGSDENVNRGRNFERSNQDKPNCESEACSCQNPKEYTNLEATVLINPEQPSLSETNTITHQGDLPNQTVADPILDAASERSCPELKGLVLLMDKFKKGNDYVLSKENFITVLMSTLKNNPAKKSDERCYQTQVELQRNYETQINKLKEKLKTERALSKQRDDLIKKYTKQKQGELSNSEKSTPLVPDHQTSSTTKKNSSTYSSDSSDISLSSSSFNTDDEQENKVRQRHESPVVFHRKDSMLNTLEIRFFEGMTKFIEGKSVGTELFCSYREWSKAIIKEMERDRVYQIKRHIFLTLSFDEKITADDRKLSFNSKEPRRLSFGNEKCEVDDFSEDGWPKEIDHMLVLHPSETKCKQIFQSSSLRGKKYLEWSTNWVDDEYYHQTTDQFGNRCFTLLLCAYVEEKNFKDARDLKTCPTCGSEYYDKNTKL